MTIYSHVISGGFMTAPLFDVKAKLSEYVSIVENGNVVEITKHGKTCAVIISVDEYSQLKNNCRVSFIEQVNKWKQKTGGLNQSEYERFEEKLARNNELYKVKEPIF